MNYINNPSVPKTSTFKECLQEHELLSSPWIHEKGFSKEIENAYNNGASKEETEEVIKGFVI